MTTCPNCNREVEPLPQDQGIGPYEFWGQRGVDRRMVLLCPKCEEELDLSYQEWKFEQECIRADFDYEKRRDERFEQELERLTK